MAWVRPERITHALQNISEWRQSVPKQASTHLLPLLALLERGAGDRREVLQRDSPHEYEFWDRYFRIGGDADKPYFNMLTLKRAEIDFPHSNAATIRKNTFDLKWHAVQRRVDGTDDYWTLQGNYAEIFREKALTKGGVTTRIPVVDVAAVMLREDDVEPGTARELERAFRARFPQSGEDYDKLFVFRDEQPESIFTYSRPAGQELVAAIERALVADHVSPTSAPAQSHVTPIIGADDELYDLLTEVQKLLEIGTSGIILSGPPATSKSRSAKRIASTLVDDPRNDVFTVQFHPSFGYEDFVEGYRPDEASKSGFQIVGKVFREACNRATKVGENRYVVILVDEINRGDPARIFGELLTYLERGYRGEEVRLPFSGDTFMVPENLLLLATMNPYDRSVSQVDAAFVRRFDHIRMEPSRETLEKMLDGTEFTVTQINMIGDWFDTAQKLLGEVGLGHAIFKDVTNLDRLKIIWRYRIRPTGEALLDVLNPTRKDDFARSFEAMVRRLEGAAE